MEELVKTALIDRLGLNEEITAHGEAVFVLRYDSQDAEDRQHLRWTELIRELVEQAHMHGLDDVLEAAHIEKHRP
ncbi:MAG: hypothetical protein HGB01_01145 [Chlorobiaceae bacterium]|nr:hypothetical protein [Chlorobiales bacterium]NTU91751.1 hypothetical protein [Chlorobiaceae bacterium]NTV24797.1 hypothetical protein [Chlorobiaceae bacterium]